MAKDKVKLGDLLKNRSKNPAKKANSWKSELPQVRWTAEREAIVEAWIEQDRQAHITEFAKWEEEKQQQLARQQEQQKQAELLEKATQAKTRLIELNKDGRLNGPSASYWIEHRPDTRIGYIVAIQEDEGVPRKELDEVIKAFRVLLAYKGVETEHTSSLRSRSDSIIANDKEAALKAWDEIYQELGLGEKKVPAPNPETNEGVVRVDTISPNQQLTPPPPLP